jgi:hypothetical protein
MFLNNSDDNSILKSRECLWPHKAKIFFLNDERDSSWVYL